MWHVTRRELLRLAAGAVSVAPTPRRALAAPRRGGSLKHIAIEPTSFDIHDDVSDPTQLASSLVRRTLFKVAHGARYGPLDFRLVPDLALKADRSADGRVYTISLRPDARWERKPPVNGRSVTAADVVYSMERARRRSPYASLLGPVEAVEAVGSHAVRVQLRSPFPPLLQNLAEPWNAVLPREVEDQWGDFKSARSLIGCGPFALERYEPGVKAIFGRNPDYYARGLPHLDRVEWIFLRDRALQLALFRAGEVDVPFHDARIPPGEAAAILGSDPRARTARPSQSRPTHAARPWDSLATRALAMRCDRPPLSDVRVRRALSAAVNRRAWVRDHFDGLGFEDSGPVPPPLAPWKLAGGDLGEGARYLAHDPALARHLLAEAGFPKGLKLKCTHWALHGHDDAEDLDRLANDLKQVGVDLVLAGEDDASYRRGSFLGRYEETTWGVSSLFTEVDSYLYTAYRAGHPANRSHVVDGEIDQALDVERHAGKTAVRKGAIDAIQRRAASQAYYLFTPTPRPIAAWSARMKNYAPKSCLDRGAQLEVVWLDGA